MPRKITTPVSVPASGSKIIEEYVGRVSTDTETVSVARMIAPPGWTEPFQEPEFDEVTLVLSGAITVEHFAGREIVRRGEVILVERGERIRYGNPFEEPAEYWAVCVPAFSPEAARRE
jgi:mannose-6-phosphate isomerase-like protein (cupin superfamily)